MLTILALVVLVPLGFWVFQIATANRIAKRDFGPAPCWFVQEDRPQNLPELVAGPSGFYVPNPLRQLNRRYIHLGIDDANVYAPHFAIAALDREGRPALWGWSYRKRDFWPISKDSWSRGGYLADFASEETILAACPDLKAPINRNDQ